MDEIKFH